MKRSKTGADYEPISPTKPIIQSSVDSQRFTGKRGAKYPGLGKGHRRDGKNGERVIDHRVVVIVLVKNREFNRLLLYSSSGTETIYKIEGP
jgi:hypothetical protein